MTPVDKRTAHRGRLLATLLAGTFLAFGSFWMLQVMLRGEQQIDTDAFKNEPDYIVEKFSFVRMTPEGKPRYLFYGAKLSHRPVDDSSEVEQPVMQNLVPGVPPMTISAQRAHIRHAENQVDLTGKVEILRPASPAARSMRLSTEALTIFPDEDRMQSDQKVSMALGGATIVGTGMKANNATQQLDFSSKGRIIYPPKAARAAPTMTGTTQ